jgi:hypothetical protein
MFKAVRGFKKQIACKLANVGLAVAQAVTRRFPTVAAWIQAQVRPCGICRGQCSTGADFL